MATTAISAPMNHGCTEAHVAACGNSCLNAFAFTGWSRISSFLPVELTNSPMAAAPHWRTPRRARGRPSYDQNVEHRLGSRLPGVSDRHLDHASDLGNRPQLGAAEEVSEADPTITTIQDSAVSQPQPEEDSSETTGRQHGGSSSQGPGLCVVVKAQPEEHEPERRQHDHDRDQAPRITSLRSQLSHGA